jgi:hypothetical protein
MKLLRDPLLHFLVIGAVLVGVFNLAGGDGVRARDEIVVGAGQIASMKATFARTWQRPPTAAELDAIVQDHIRDEVFYREAVAMGLDKDDAVVRRRMRQKMEFVSDVAADTEPTDAELKAFVAEHPDWFRAEPRFSFSHVYFKAGSGGGPSAAELERLTEALNAGTADASLTGDPFMSGFEFQDLTRSGVAQTFGESFAEWMDSALPGAWAGPAVSAYGVHLVRVSDRVEAGDPPFEDVRDAARREWLHARRVAAGEALYQKLRSRYTITVEAAPAESRVARAAP